MQLESLCVFRDAHQSKSSYRITMQMKSLSNDSGFIQQKVKDTAYFGLH